MNTEKEQRESIRIRMKQKSTAELLDIWKKNDRCEWTDEAFEIMGEILSARVGSLPAQGQVAESQEEKTDQGSDGQEEDTYHDFNTLVRISSWAKFLSWFALGLLILLFVLDILAVVLIVRQEGLDSSYLSGMLWTPLVSSTVPMLCSAAFFIIMQVIAEGVYLLADIEDNTRRVATLLESNIKKTP